MVLLNTENRYGLVHILLHWGMAIAIVGMFCLGLWMVDLDYYDAWYKRGPDLHRSIGILIVLALLIRLVYRFAVGVPKPLPTHSRPERILAQCAHGLLYALVLLVATAGYLISTADGHGVWVFDWFEIPATLTAIENQEDVAGDIHLYLAIGLVTLAGLHGLAALKHHFIDRDATLVRMLSPGSKPGD